MKYRIVSDSTSNIFHISEVSYVNVPLKIITAEKEYADTPELDTAEMIEDLKKWKGTSGSSCPNVHEWMEAFGDADIVFAVTITGALSGSYSAAVHAGVEYMEQHEGAKVFVVDSKSAGPEMQLLIEKLRTCILKEMTFEEIREAVCDYQDHTHLLFSLESLTNLANNGRVNPVVAKAAGFLGIRLVGKASDEGTLEPLHKCRGEKKTLEMILSEMKKGGFQGGKVRIAHCQNPVAAASLEKLILRDFPSSRIEILACAGLCSYYAEKGGLMIGYEDVRNER